ncbi:hypothetical protein J6590_104687, partial [Homalodisca vitripennis]
KPQDEDTSSAATIQYLDPRGKRPRGTAYTMANIVDSHHLMIWLQVVIVLSNTAKMETHRQRPQFRIWIQVVNVHGGTAYTMANIVDSHHLMIWLQVVIVLRGTAMMKTYIVSGHTSEFGSRW